MLFRLLTAAALSVGSPAGSESATDDVVETIEEAIVLLEREIELVPAADPGRAGEDGFEAAREELAEVERAGAIALADLRSRDVVLSPAIVSALGAAPPDAAGARPTPPPLETYASAIADLRQLGRERSEELAASAPGAASPDGSSGPSTMLFVVAVLAGVAALVGLGAVLVRQHRKNLSIAVEESLTDPLTKLANRRRLDRDVGELSGGAHDRVAVLMVDVDHFKQFNDNHGHAVGDAVLRQVATLISMQIRADDVVYRYGGEEFCVLLPGATVAEAHVIAERIRGCVANVDSPTGARPITVSIGLAEDRASSTRAAIVHADIALLRAKQSGRDRTVLATDPRR